MRQTNHPQDSSTGDLERLLDAALAKYADARPHTGLEERILANLRAGQSREVTRSWWKWGFAAAAVAAVALLAIAVSLRFGETAHPVIAKRPPVSSRASRNSPFVAEVHAESHETIAPVRRVRRTPKHPAQPAAVIADSPKLDQFPSPQPLSEQELALVRYVRSFPKEAMLIAQAQEEFDLEAQRQMNNGALQNQRSDSIQQER
ncbi:MAG: hypothetical protein WAM79_15400 [Candidatus Sulfotelmatobacter sp.]